MSFSSNAIGKVACRRLAVYSGITSMALIEG
jgi:hypothetical protein